jgi:hypothetical protein
VRVEYSVDETQEDHLLGERSNEPIRCAEMTERAHRKHFDPAVRPPALRTPGNEAGAPARSGDLST